MDTVRKVAGSDVSCEERGVEGKFEPDAGAVFGVVRGAPFDGVLLVSTGELLF